MLLMVSVQANNLTVERCEPVWFSESTTDLAALSKAKEYDFSYLKPGETAEITHNDDKGNPIRYRVTRTSDGLDIAIYMSSLENADPGTRIIFKGPKGVVSSSTVGQIVSRRCGWLCVVAHVLCVKVHVGPPGNTWEWNCKGNAAQN